MRFLLILITLFFSLATAAQTITTYDYVKTKEGEHDNYIQFVQKNWVVAREKAKEKGYIISYKVEISTDTLADVILITEYRDQSTFEQRENIFLQIYKEHFPKGAILINGKRSKDMADIRLSKEMRNQ